MNIDVSLRSTSDVFYSLNDALNLEVIHPGASGSLLRAQLAGIYEAKLNPAISKLEVLGCKLRGLVPSGSVQLACWQQLRGSLYRSRTLECILRSIWSYLPSREPEYRYLLERDCSEIGRAA